MSGADPVRAGGIPLLFFALAILLFPQAFLGQGTFFHYDTWQQNLTFRAWWFGELKSGHFATWCPGLFAGYPLFAETQTGPLYPPTFVLFSLLPPTLAFSWSVILHFAFAGTGAWLLARRLGAASLPAVAAGVAYELSGFLITHVVHFNLLTGAAWTPWAICFALGAWSGGLRSAIGLGVAVGGLLLGAHPYATFMTLLLTGLALLFRTGVRPRPLAAGGGILAGAIALGTGLAAVQVLPTREFLARTTRGEAVDYSFLTFGSFPPWNVATLAAPDLFGTPVNGTWYAGPDWSHFAETCAYLGLPALALAVAALLLRRDRATLFAGTAGAVSLLLMLGKYTPAYRAVGAFPLLQSTRLPARFALTFSLSLALLAALGLDALLRESVARRRRRALAVGAALLLGLGGMAYWLGGEARAPDPELAVTGRAWPATLEAIRANATGVLRRTAGVLGLTIVALAPLATRRPPRALAALPVVILIAADALQWGATFNPVIPPELVTEPPPVVKALPEVAPRPRIFRQGVSEMWGRSPGQPRVDLFTPAWKGHRDSYASGAWALPPNSQLLYGVDSGEGFTSLLPLPWLEWMGCAARAGATPRPDLTEAQADLLSLDAVISSGSGIAGEGWEATELPGDLWLSRHRDPLPRARLARSWRVVEDRGRLLGRLRDPAHDPREAVLLEREPPGLPRERAAGAVDEPLPAQETGPGRWEIEVPPGSGGIVVISESHDPDWIAEDAAGRAIPIFRADGLFLGFPAPEEGGRVRLRHAPASVLRGGAISAVCVLLGIAGVALGSGGGRRRLRLPSLGARWSGEALPAWTPWIAAAAVVVVSGVLDVGDWRRDRAAATLSAAACRAWSEEATAAHRAGADEAAARLLRAALTRNPESALLHYRLGIVERALGREEAAARAFERAGSLDPSIDPP